MTIMTSEGLMVTKHAHIYIAERLCLRENRMGEGEGGRRGRIEEGKGGEKEVVK